MKISNNKNKNNSGFTLIELVVVIAGLAALASFSIPNFLNSMKLNKIEEAKAIMNGYASDCLGKYRISTDPVEFIEKAIPDQLDNTRLNTLGYQLDGAEKSKCSHLAIKPSNIKEKDLYAFDFRMSSEGLVLKTGTPSSNPRFLNSCRGWAGKNCGLSDAQKAEFARLAALAKAKSECISTYNNWLAAGSSGENMTWNNETETCNRRVFAFEGIPVNSAEAIETALKAKYGKACADWRVTKKNSISPNGKPETLTPQCGGVNYWFHSGKEFTTQSDWDAFDNQVKEQACINDRSNALSQNISGQYTYGPTPGPDPCGKVVWLCQGAEYSSPDAYASTSCGKPKNPPVSQNPYDPCTVFKMPAICRARPYLQGKHPSCSCK